MSTADELLVAPCDTKAARWAVEHWHYSGTLPLGRTVRYGVWWAGEFRGAVIFARGSTPHLHRRYGLTEIEIAELCRVALTTHPEFTVTAVVARALDELHRSNPGLRLVVSFADPNEGHLGRIYQAGNWVYLGRSTPARELFIDGKWTHSRTFSGRMGFAGAGDDKRRRTPDERRALPSRVLPPKYRYAYPLDRAMRRRLSRMALPYPAALDEPANV